MSNSFDEDDDYGNTERADIIIEALCYSCEHFLANKRCSAFLNGIPAEILNMSHDHRLPYLGDNGIVYGLRGL